MIHQTLTRAGNALRSVNPSLLSNPPPIIETTGVDVCYKGPNGEIDADKVVFCRHLPGGTRRNVGR